MKKKEEKVLNYFFSIGFILMIALILVVFVVISRLVLSDVNPIAVHVRETKDLLNDISEVERAAAKNIENSNSTILAGRERELIEFNEIPTNITDIAIRNVREGKSIITIHVSNQIAEEDGVFYMKINDISTLERNDVLAYPTFNGVQTGTIIAMDEEEGVFVLRVNETIERIPRSEILGKVFFIQND